ncbi:MAG: hypothetical protein IJZ30_04305 [Alphaproteobacteria bacterium]|nr:hypothetical protein [Alphaproteobacteria bacterium]
MKIKIKQNKNLFYGENRGNKYGLQAQCSDKSCYVEEMIKYDSNWKNTCEKVDNVYNYLVKKYNS